MSVSQPISFGPQNMPVLSTPPTFACFTSTPLAVVTPGRAMMKRLPATMFEAFVTTSIRSSLACQRTLHNFSLSFFGIGDTSTTSQHTGIGFFFSFFSFLSFLSFLSFFSSSTFPSFFFFFLSPNMAFRSSSGALVCSSSSSSSSSSLSSMAKALFFGAALAGAGSSSEDGGAAAFGGSSSLSESAVLTAFLLPFLSFGILATGHAPGASPVGGARCWGGSTQPKLA
mmetsp:Transcript_45595/g.132742  ORF Transcript_45595/g.132742 Transcript_45595/m.132742 type:complete len:227 (+) Transcript_45595:741-1421(+)